MVQTAEQVDIDVLGADFGLGMPVVAFVVRPAQVIGERAMRFGRSRRSRSCCGRLRAEIVSGGR